MFGAGESDGVPLGLVLNGAAVVGEFDQVDLDEGDVGFEGELDFSEFETSEGRTWRIAGCRDLQVCPPLPHLADCEPARRDCRGRASATIPTVETEKILPNM